MISLNRLSRRVLKVALLLGLYSCIEPFELKDTAAAPSYLVVDGFINLAGPTRIRLTRTASISSTESPTAEAKAQLYIEQEAGQRYPLREVSAGSYRSDSLQLLSDKRYRLYFKTNGQQEYASDYTTGRRTPMIDSISWKVQREGLRLYANTHDPTNQTRYYRWDYAETWEYTTPWFALYDYKLPGGPVLRNLKINHCWNTLKSTNIVVSNTTRLSQDVVSEYPLQLVPYAASYKINEKYSILVRQYAQTAEEYSYWEKLRKNTENIGTLFDPLPTQLTGNVEGITNPAEVVLGYVGAYSVTEKRLFIARNELPQTMRLLTGYENCGPPDTVRIPSDLDFLLRGEKNIFLNQGLYGYIVTPPDCGDCRKRGGTLQKPAFWQ